MIVDNISFLDQLVARNIINQDQLDVLLIEYKNDEYSIASHLMRNNIASRKSLGQIWGDCMNTAYIELDKTLVQEHVVQLLPENEARRYNAIPIYKTTRVTVATSNPTNELIIRELEKFIGEEVSPVFCFQDEIEEAIALYYTSITSLKDLNMLVVDFPLIREDIILTAEQLQEIAGERAIVNILDEIIITAIKEKASDIHIEPEEKAIKLRYRIDGMLYEKAWLDKNILPALVSRIKIISGLDIVEKRKPLDGRISFKIGTRNIDIRVSTVPTVYGEKTCMRILGHSAGKSIPDLTDLLFSKNIYNQSKKIIDNPNGIFFITGPTGSGKTTTLFSMLKYLNKPETNITTIEDPVEYRLSGINQIQVNTAVDLTFATALRAFLRQDPDVILIGEIRDVETARIASQAALTGHLVLATMHTNNSIQAITRLIEIGVEPFLVAPSIIGVMAQRLVRRLCENCKEAYLVTPEQLEKYFEVDIDDPKIYFYKPKGCKHCNNTGYSGRIGIHEIFMINDNVRKLISDGVSTMEIQNYAESKGFKSLWYDGLKKVLRGYTSIEELSRVVVVEE